LALTRANEAVLSHIKTSERPQTLLARSHSPGGAGASAGFSMSPNSLWNKGMARQQGDISDPRSFWGEISPCDHVVQIYETDLVFLDALEGFVSGGLRSGDAVVVIAGVAHLAALEDRLRALGFDLAWLRARGLYIRLDAREALSRFMVQDWPDEQLFRQFVQETLDAAGERRVRAFGEMVAVLWAEGKTGATVRLEHLWHRICQESKLSLFCAYPRIGFTKDSDDAIREICEAHSRIIAEY